MPNKRPLSKEQLRYAQDRIWAVERKEHDALIAESWIKDDERAPTTVAELVSLIKRGKVEVKCGADVAIHRYMLVRELFDIYVPDGIRKIDEPKRRRLQEAHDKKWQAIKDTLMLSDAEETLKLITSLSV